MVQINRSELRRRFGKKDIAERILREADKPRPNPLDEICKHVEVPGELRAQFDREVMDGLFEYQVQFEGDAAANRGIAVVFPAGAREDSSARQIYAAHHTFAAYLNSINSELDDCETELTKLKSEKARVEQSSASLPSTISGLENRRSSKRKARKTGNMALMIKDTQRALQINGNNLKKLNRSIDNKTKKYKACKQSFSEAKKRFQEIDELSTSISQGIKPAADVFKGLEQRIGYVICGKPERKSMELYFAAAALLIVGGAAILYHLYPTKQIKNPGVSLEKNENTDILLRRDDNVRVIPPNTLKPNYHDLKGYKKASLYFWKAAINMRDKSGLSRCVAEYYDHDDNEWKDIQCAIVYGKEKVDLVMKSDLDKGVYTFRFVAWDVAGNKNEQLVLLKYLGNQRYKLLSNVSK